MSSRSSLFRRIFDELVGGRFIAIVFFGLLFSAAFTSSYSWLMVVVAPLREELRMSKGRSALIATGAMLALGNSVGAQLHSATTEDRRHARLGLGGPAHWIGHCSCGRSHRRGADRLAAAKRAKLVQEMSARAWRDRPGAVFSLRGRGVW